MEELEKEKIYTEALERLTSALSNEDVKREALAALASLGDYRDAPALLEKHRMLMAEDQLEAEKRAKRRRITVVLQWLMTGVGALLALAILFLILYGILT